MGKKSLKSAAKAAHSIEKVKSSQKEHRGFNPALGDQAVRLLDKAIALFRKRRNDLLKGCEADEKELAQLHKDIANCDWHINKIKGGMAERKDKLASVTLALEKFGCRPDEED